VCCCSVCLQLQCTLATCWRIVCVCSCSVLQCTVATCWRTVCVCSCSVLLQRVGAHFPRALPCVKLVCRSSDLLQLQCAVAECSCSRPFRDLFRVSSCRVVTLCCSCCIVLLQCVVAVTHFSRALPPDPGHTSGSVSGIKILPFFFGLSSSTNQHHHLVMQNQQISNLVRRMRYSTVFITQFWWLILFRQWYSSTIYSTDPY